MNIFLKYTLFIFLSMLIMPDRIVAQEKQHPSRPKVFVFDIKAEIDPRSNRSVKLALEQAEESKADYVIIDIDTYGGTLNDADEIRKRILKFPKPVYAFININAASAGALISIACDSIYMTKGASIGAATVVGMDGQPVADKYQSYMRSLMRSTAEANGRDPKIAEAMVGRVTDSLFKPGQVLTFSTLEAIQNGYCEGEVSSVEDILKKNNITNYKIERFELGAADKIIAFFLNPFISGLLILIIIGGIYFELQTPGIGFPLLAAGVALILYFTPYYLNGLAENWEIAIFFVGLVLLAIEIFVIPGFGVAGISGIVLIVSSLILSMLNNDFFDFSFVDPANFFKATVATLGGLVGGFILMFFVGIKLSDSTLFRKVSLQQSLKTSDGYTSDFKPEPLIGETGIAYTVLRPSGKILIGETIYDAYTRGGYIEKGSKIKVIEQGVNTLKVEKA